MESTEDRVSQGSPHDQYFSSSLLTLSSLTASSRVYSSVVCSSAEMPIFSSLSRLRAALRASLPSPGRDFPSARGLLLKDRETAGCTTEEEGWQKEVEASEEEEEEQEEEVAVANDGLAKLEKPATALAAAERANEEGRRVNDMLPKAQKAENMSAVMEQE